VTYDSEVVYQNLFNLLSQTQMLTNRAPNGTPAFTTTSRRLPPANNVSGVQQPALYMLEGEDDIEEKSMALAKEEWHCAAMIFFRNTGNAESVASTQLNKLRDAVIYQLRERTLASDGTTVIPLLGGGRQTLGGVVFHARPKGRLLKNEGLQNNQGAFVVPISILSGM
jgi:hypothetical protein